MDITDYDWDRLDGLGYTEKATGDLKKACWKGYTAVGLKKKGGRTVPNCVPIKKSDHSESDSPSDGRISPDTKRKPVITGPSAGSPSFAEKGGSGKPCGDSHIPKANTCHVGGGRSREEREKAAGETLKRLARQEPKTDVKKESYSWGDLVTVSKGNQYKAVLHPEHQDALRKLKDGESHTFTDEQKHKWTATRDGDAINLNSKAGKLSVSRSDLGSKSEPKRDPSKDVKRGNTLIGTSPRNKLIDNINGFKARLKDARSDAERKFLEETIAKAEAQLEKEGG